MSGSAFADTADNRSMPAATVIPLLGYADVPAAVAWLCNVGDVAPDTGGGELIASAASSTRNE